MILDLVAATVVVEIVAIGADVSFAVEISAVVAAALVDVIAARSVVISAVAVVVEHYAVYLVESTIGVVVDVVVAVGFADSVAALIHVSVENADILVAVAVVVLVVV